MMGGGEKKNESHFNVVGHGFTCASLNGHFAVIEGMHLRDFNILNAPRLLLTAQRCDCLMRLHFQSVPTGVLLSLCLLPESLRHISIDLNANLRACL